MKYVGAHVSAEGGVDKAPGNAASIGARAFALFTRNQRQWQAKRLSAEEVAAFRTNCREAGYSPAQILAHDSYLINLGHAPIGRGKIGLEPFRLIMNDARFEEIPLILETPESERWAEEIELLYGLAVYPPSLGRTGQDAMKMVDRKPR